MYVKYEIIIRFKKEDKYFATIPFGYYEQARDAYHKLEKELDFYAMSLIEQQTVENVLHRNVRAI
jgi:hypothetical protein